MSEQEKIDLRNKICNGLKLSFQNLLRHKATLDQDMVFADENGLPRIVPAKVSSLPKKPWQSILNPINKNNQEVSG